MLDTLYFHEPGRKKAAQPETEMPHSAQTAVGDPTCICFPWLLFGQHAEIFLKYDCRLSQVTRAKWDCCTSRQKGVLGGCTSNSRCRPQCRPEEGL